MYMGGADCLIGQSESSGGVRFALIEAARAQRAEAAGPEETLNSLEQLASLRWQPCGGGLREPRPCQ